MRKEEDLTILLKALYKSAPQKVAGADAGAAGCMVLDDGYTVYEQDRERIIRFSSRAQVLDGRLIETTKAQRVSYQVTEKTDVLGSGKMITVVYEMNQLQLRQEVTVYEEGMMTVQIFLKDGTKETVTRFLAPFVTPYPQKEDKPLFLSLDQKMLTVPYDNDMWLRYESSVPACGRKSYDVTAVYDENSLEGLIIGALNFDVWKNAICWASHDARSLVAFCGAADEGTHDICPHTPVRGEWVASSGFVIFWSSDVRRGMERYGDLCKKIMPPRPWERGKVPFGWNSYSALAMGLRLSHWQEAGEFMRTELPEFCDEEGVVYVNLDGAFGLDEDEIRETVERMHGKGQKAGWYLNPCNWFAAGGAMGAEGTDVTMEDLFLKDLSGQVMPASDGTVPLDVTHSQWEVMARASVKRLVNLGMDYIKLDFLSHGAVEGAHYLSDYTGRMALNHAYRILSDEISRADREIFVSLSIAPLFPYFLGNARRCCCDTFGHHEDVRYVLNALNFAWWTNGRLYRYNDPDHIPLYLSVVDGREPTMEAEARSRYYASVISGTVMMLSDNYGPLGDEDIIEMSRKRAVQFANDKKINEIARWGKAFVPVELKDGTTPFYTLTHNERMFAAIFNFADKTQTLSFEAKQGNLPEQGFWQNLCGEGKTAYEGRISVTLDAYDAVLLEIYQ